MSEWRTMRSAPRDSTPFLAWCAEGADGEPHWAVCYVSISRTLCYDVGEIVDDDTFKPTHWMPLPQPPGAKP